MVSQVQGLCISKMIPRIFKYIGLLTMFQIRLLKIDLRFIFPMLLCRSETYPPQGRTLLDKFVITANHIS
jgi:hypothetical protein